MLSLTVRSNLGQGGDSSSMDCSSIDEKFKAMNEGELDYVNILNR